MTSDDGSLQDWIPLISVDAPASADAVPLDGAQTNRLALAHLYMKFGWHPAPVHSFTLPLWFGGLYDEQRAARDSAVIFDRSHLGRFYVTGERAAEVLDSVFATSIASIPLQGLRRAMVCREDGVVLDVATVCHLDEGRWLVVTGPQTQSHLLGMVGAAVDDGGLTAEVEVRDRITESVQFSVQGPQAAKLLEAIVGITIPGAVPEGEAHELLLGGYRALVAHTSQIGDDGYWFIVSPEVGEHFFENAVSVGVTPAGLAAHDALRLEAGVLEAPYETPAPATPAAVGLGELVDLAGREFPGAEALRALSGVAPERVLRGVRLTGRGLAKRGSRVKFGGADGEAGSGALVNAAYSAFLGASIGIGYLPSGVTTVQVDVDGELVAADVVAVPFVEGASVRGEG
ncbi:MAG: aminomethyl transferase family protein [Dehalococcoidia bacterium]|nr:aminomethyl transferase family protein [Dehalococcoidia bacterium]